MLMVSSSGGGVSLPMCAIVYLGAYSGLYWMAPGGKP